MSDAKKKEKERKERMREREWEDKTRQKRVPGHIRGRV